MKKCIIIAAGDFNEDVVIKEEGDYLIASDAGYKNFLSLKNSSIHDIDLLIGDFDSMDLKDVKLSSHTVVNKLNPIKDDSDTFDAVLEGIKLGYKEFYLYGMLGKRLEHSLGNIYILAFLKEKGCKGYIFDKDIVVELISDEEICFDKNYKGYISCYPFLGKCEKVNISGLKYELKDYTLSYMNPTLGLDNEFIGMNAKISVEDGMLLLIYHKK